MRTVIAVLVMAYFSMPAFAQAEKIARVESMRPEKAAGVPKAEALERPENALSPEYLIGADDVLDISVLQPEKMLVTVTVSPDGAITFPYIGAVNMKGKTLERAQNDIQSRLADGYMKYPIVSIALKQSAGGKFFVYGEVMKPGTYRLEENVTILKAISLSGGFTRFGSASRVKVLRAKDGGAGYQTIKVNLKAAMNGSSKDDIMLRRGDIVMVEEGIF